MTKLEKLLATRGFKEIPEYMWWFNIDARMASAMTQRAMRTKSGSPNNFLPE